MTPGEFSLRIKTAEMWLGNMVNRLESDYLHAYRYGVRRLYHGRRFGSESEVFAFDNGGEPSKAGFEDGVSGRMPDFARLQRFAAA
jgi:hypothetical protein